MSTPPTWRLDRWYRDQVFADGTPIPDPPAWQEQEWCDGGGSCHHRSCLQLVYAEIDPEIEVVPGGLRMKGLTEQ